MNDVYRFRLITEIFSPNVVYCSHTETLSQSLGLEPASTSLKLTYIFWRGQSSKQKSLGPCSKSIPNSAPHQPNWSLQIVDEVNWQQKKNSLLSSLFQFFIISSGRDGRDGRKGSAGARGMPGLKGIQFSKEFILSHYFSRSFYHIDRFLLVN